MSWWSWPTSPESRAAAVAEELTGAGHTALAREVDVSDRESLRSLAAECATLGRVTRVAHTAGVSPMQADIDTIVRVDLVGTALVLEEFGAVVAEGGAGVVVASMAGQIFGPHLSADEIADLAHEPAEALARLPWFGRVQDPQTAYGYAKRGNQLRVATAAATWAARGARINSVSPGVIDTEMGRTELSGETGDLVHAQIDASAIGRAADPDEIAAAVEFLLGPGRLLRHRHRPARRRGHDARLPPAPTELTFEVGQARAWNALGFWPKARRAVNPVPKAQVNRPGAQLGGRVSRAGGRDPDVAVHAGESKDQALLTRSPSP